MHNDTLSLLRKKTNVIYLIQAKIKQLNNFNLFFQTENNICISIKKIMIDHCNFLLKFVNSCRKFYTRSFYFLILMLLKIQNSNLQRDINSYQEIKYSALKLLFKQNNYALQDNFSRQLELFTDVLSQIKHTIITVKLLKLYG